VSSRYIIVNALDDVDLLEVVDGRLHLKLSATSSIFSRWVTPVCGCADTDVGDEVCRCDYERAVPITEDLSLTLAGI
jgi:hypothetical protein